MKAAALDESVEATMPQCHIYISMVHANNITSTRCRGHGVRTTPHLMISVRFAAG